MSLLPPRTKKAIVEPEPEVGTSVSILPIVEPASEPSLTDVLKLIAQSLAAGAQSNRQQLESLAQILTTQQQREARRQDEEDLNTAAARVAGRHVGATGAYENNFPPNISAYNPLGERDHPTPDLKCEMIYVGYKLPKVALTLEEITLLNRLEPGVYRVTKADGRKIPYTVQAKMSDTGKLERLMIHFPCKSTEDRHNHQSMVAYLREVLQDTQPPVDALLAQIESLKAQLTQSH